MDDLHRRLAVRIKALAKGRRLSANKLADFADVGRGYLSDILAGHKSPTVRTLAKLAKVLEVEVKDLLQ